MEKVYDSRILVLLLNERDGTEAAMDMTIDHESVREFIIAWESVGATVKAIWFQDTVVVNVIIGKD